MAAVVDLLVAQLPLPASYSDHHKGDWKGWRDLHLEPDWLLIYRITGQEFHLPELEPARIFNE